jgi:hypothetical protein
MSPNPQRRAWFLLVLLCLAVYGAAFVTRQVLVPGIVPVAFAEEPQSSSAVQAAFLLRAIEMTAGLGGMMLLIAAFGALVNARAAKTARAEKGALFLTWIKVSTVRTPASGMREAAMMLAARRPPTCRPHQSS